MTKNDKFKLIEDPAGVIEDILAKHGNFDLGMGTSLEDLVKHGQEHKKKYGLGPSKRDVVKTKIEVK